MTPSASQILARRWWARLVIRAVALAAVLWGSIGGAGAGSSDLTGTLNTLLQVPGVQLPVVPLVLSFLVPMLVPLAIAATLIWFERRIVRWLVPIPTHRCPRCDYSLIGVHESRCPECGLPLDEALVGRDEDDAFEDPRPTSGPSPSTGRAPPSAPGASTAPPVTARPAAAASPGPRPRETRPSDPE